MHRKLLIALCGAVLALAALFASGGFAAAAGTSVVVRVEGLKKTLLAPKRVKTTGPAVSKDGHSCSGSSGAGALNRGTHGHWSGKWFSGLGIEVYTILGETNEYSTTHSYWEVFVNNVASLGVCSITLHKGDQLLLAAVPDTGTEYPLGESAPKTVKVGHMLKVKVVGYGASGKAKPLAGATVKLGSKTVKTNSHGVASLKPTKAGKLIVQASDKGWIRAAPLSVRVTP